MIIWASLCSTLLALAIYQDWQVRRIPNYVVIAVLAGGLLAKLLAVQAWPPFWPWLGYSLAAFTLFALGLYGAGDAKLLMALLLSIDASYWLEFIALVALCGGIWALIFSLIKPYFKSQKDLPGLPYAAAISLPACLCLWLQAWVAASP